MKSLLQRIVALPFSGSLLAGLCASQIFVLPVLADEFMNISDVKGCRAIGGDAERLLCYDTVTDGGIFNEQQLKQAQVESFGSSALRKEETPVAPATPVKPAAAASASSTGAETASVSAAATPATPATNISIDRITVTIKRVKKDGSGIHYFQTSDGQVWKQRNAGAWSSKVPFEAEIKAGIMGSFFLINEGGKSTRVKRVK